MIKQLHKSITRSLKSIINYPHKTPYLVYGIAMLAIFAGNSVRVIKPYLGVLIAVLFLYIPMFFLIFKKKRTRAYGIDKTGMRKGIIRALILGLIIFPLYSAGFYLYMRYYLNMRILFSIGAPMQILKFALDDLLMVAIPEEVFYRGYLQSELRKYDKTYLRVFGVNIGPSFIIVNILFAAGHLIAITNVSRMAVFFPGLVFSWLREKDDNIAGSVVFHWLSNVLSFLLFGLLI